MERLGTLHLRASGMRQDHRHRFGGLVEEDRHGTLFAEASLAGRSDATSWSQARRSRPTASARIRFPVFDYIYDVPAAFAQVEHDLRPDPTIAASARLDLHNEYGTQLSPRLSALYRPGPWTIRVRWGAVYAPTPFVEEIEAVGLSRLEPVSGLEAETAQTASIDAGYARGPLEARVTFSIHIDDATRLEAVAAERVRLINVDGETRIRGSEPCFAIVGTLFRSAAAMSMSMQPSRLSEAKAAGRYP